MGLPTHVQIGRSLCLCSFLEKRLGNLMWEAHTNQQNRSDAFLLFLAFLPVYTSGILWPGSYVVQAVSLEEIHKLLCPHLALWERRETGKNREMGLLPKSPPTHSTGMWTLSPQSSQWIKKESRDQGGMLTCEPGHNNCQLPQIQKKISAQQSKLLSSWGGWTQFGHQFPSVFSYFKLWNCRLLTLKFQNKILFGVYIFMLSN